MDSTDYQVNDDCHSENDQLASYYEHINENVYNIDSHVKLVTLLRSMGDLDQLREARNQFLVVLPLPSNLWIEWLEDEFELIGTNYESAKSWVDLAHNCVKENPIDFVLCKFVFEKAVKLSDTFSSSISVPEIIEGMLVIAGHHLGYQLWILYLEWAKAKRPDLLDSIARRIAAIPFIGYNQIVSTLAMHINTKLIAKDIIEKIHDWEAKIETLDFGTCLKYIEWLRANNFEHTYIRCLFERALAINPSTIGVWVEYLEFMRLNLKVSVITLSIAERAVKHCPWSVKLWGILLLAMEKAHVPLERIQEKLELAEMASVTNVQDAASLYICWCQIARRTLQDNHQRIISIFRASLEQLEILFQEGSYALERELANFALLVNELQLYNATWESILKKNSKCARIWLYYIGLETGRRDFNSVHNLYTRATNSVTDSPEKIFNQWVVFENSFGTTESLEFAEERIKNQRKLIKDREAEAATKIQTEFPQKSHHDRKRPLLKSDQNHELGNEDMENLCIDGSSRVKNTKVLSSSLLSSTVQLPIVHPERAIFVSNLLFELEEEELKRFFEKHVGLVEKVRLVRKPSGKSQGYGEVVFGDERLVSRALELDRTRINGRPIFIKPYRVGPAAQNFGFNERYKSLGGKEPKTLYISKLSLDTSEAKLMELFSPCLGFKAVRLVTTHGGKSRGYAYADFENEVNAEMAAKQLDGIEIDGQVISVLISDPLKAPSKQAQLTSLVPRNTMLRPPSRKIQIE